METFTILILMDLSSFYYNLLSNYLDTRETINHIKLLKNYLKKCGNSPYTQSSKLKIKFIS